MTVFITALYDTKGILVRASQGDPIWTDPTPQQVADMIARAADSGCTYNAGTVHVWTGLDVEPAEWIQDNPEPDGARAFGPGELPVPAYRWERRADWATVLVPVS
jgi:hypothetical protein